MSNFKAVEAFSQNISKTDKEEKKLGSIFFKKKPVKYSVFTITVQQRPEEKERKKNLKQPHLAQFLKQ